MENTQMKPAEMLEQVNKAIAAVLVGGQSYKIGSRSLTRADLSMLKSMRDDLEARWRRAPPPTCWIGPLWPTLTGGDGGPWGFWIIS